MTLDSLGDWRKIQSTRNISTKLDGEEITVFGWVREIRDLGAIKFVILQDRRGTVQITIRKKEASKPLLRRARNLQMQDCIGVKGIVKKTDITQRGFEIIPKEIRILGKSQHPLPLDVTGKTPATIDTRLDARILDLCNNENRAIWIIQNSVLRVLRSFLYKEGFIEIFTPRIIATTTEGGAALFSVEYFQTDAYLAQSPQLYKEELTLCFEKVFEIGPFFRAEESHTRRHLSEFISIDIEQSFVSYEDAMDLLEKLISIICLTVKNECKQELKILRQEVDVPELPLPRFSYTQILDELKDKGVEIPWGEDISTGAYRTLGELHPYFYFITDWPTKAKPFYIKPRDDDTKVSEGFDFMWKWMELASGGTRIHSKGMLIQRMEEQKLDPDAFKHHLRVFDYGLPPHSGWAIGLERLLMMLTGKRNIREVVLFPRDRTRLIP